MDFSIENDTKSESVGIDLGKCIWPSNWSVLSIFFGDSGNNVPWDFEIDL